VETSTDKSKKTETSVIDSSIIQEQSKTRNDLAVKEKEFDNSVPNAGYSLGEEAEVKRPSIIQQSCRTQSRTAFPMPPPPEHAEALLRNIDNLNMPNVSPDSGIQSVESSPSGNDSPGSVTSLAAGEHAHEHQVSASTVHSQTEIKVKDPLPSKQGAALQVGDALQPHGKAANPGQENVVTRINEKSCRKMCQADSTVTSSVKELPKASGECDKVSMPVNAETNVHGVDGGLTFKSKKSKATCSDQNKSRVKTLAEGEVKESANSDPSTQSTTVHTPVKPSGHAKCSNTSIMEKDTASNSKAHKEAKEDLSCNEIKADSGTADKSSEPSNDHNAVSSSSVATGLVLPANLCLDPLPTDLPSPFKGPSMGRKKRGHPAKRKKSQMLQHKQSTLYKELYSSDASGSSSQHVNVYPSTLSTPSETESSVAKGVSLDGQDSETSLLSKHCTGTDASDNTKKTVSKTDVLSKGLLVKKGRKGKKKLKKSVTVGVSATIDISDESTSSLRRRPGRPKGSKNKPKAANSLLISEAKYWNAVGVSASRRSVEETDTSSEVPPVPGLVPSAAELVKARSAALEARKRVLSSPKKAALKQGGHLKRLKNKGFAAMTTKKEQALLHGETNVPKKRGRGRPRKRPLPVKAGTTSKAISALPVKTKAVADSELASLIQSVQNSIHSQFSAPDLEESNDFVMGGNEFDFAAIEPSLPRVKTVSPTKTLELKGNRAPDVAKKVVSKYKKPKVHVMMRNTKRRKKKVQKLRPESSASSEISSTKEQVHMGMTFRELSEQECASSGSAFSSSSSKPVQYYPAYQPFKLIKQSSFRLQASALGSALQCGEDSSDDDHDGSEGRKKKKKKRLLYFKSKHKNILDPAFMSQLQSLQTGMDKLAISEQAFIRVKPGEVPLPSIFKLAIIDVKKKKKDKLILEPLALPEKCKKIKIRKDSKEREVPMPELTKEKVKGTRKLKSQTEEISPPNLEIQTQRDQCLPPKKRHRMMFTAEPLVGETDTAADPLPEKRKVGRSRKVSGESNFASLCHVCVSYSQSLYYHPV
jgi:hypothetical protein